MASIDYRLLFRGGSIANSVQDVDDALSWWRSQTETYNLNPNRISAMGLSAGAALALLAAERHADALAHTVVWFGVYDFDELHGLLGQMVHRFLLKNEDSKAWSPIERVTKLPTPLLALHGTADRLIDYRQAERFRDARLQAGLPTELITYEGLPHGFLNNAKGPMALAAVEEVIAALRS